MSATKVWQVVDTAGQQSVSWSAARKVIIYSHDRGGNSAMIAGNVYFVATGDSLVKTNQ